ncbi:TIGR01244 family sulfur transferase [Altererythrobacter sp. MF3-039]|uniref:TIGR01244 family sulfur transferase n=1 Tax=Altererythrobacter sp. MF3-039 TaxID=3252901 RepID=UPI00390CB457
MSDFRKLSDTVSASPQISLADLETAGTDGVGLIVCNRPDDEEPGQLNVGEIEASAKERGMAFAHIPITHAGFSQTQVAAMREALDNAEGKVLAYCRSGTRSTLLWALAEASIGRDPDDIASRAMAAGYDVSPVRPAMDMLASQAGG